MLWQEGWRLSLHGQILRLQGRVDQSIEEGLLSLMMIRAAQISGLLLAIALADRCEAQSLTTRQENAANHLAQILAIEIECPEFEADQTSVALLMMVHKLEFSQEPLASRMPQWVVQHRNGLRAAGGKVGCLVGWGLYGPGGQNVPNLLRRK